MRASVAVFRVFELNSECENPVHFVSSSEDTKGRGRVGVWMVSECALHSMVLLADCGRHSFLQGHETVLCQPAGSGLREFPAPVVMHTYVSCVRSWELPQPRSYQATMQWSSSNRSSSSCLRSRALLHRTQQLLSHVSGIAAQAVHGDRP